MTENQKKWNEIYIQICNIIKTKLKECGIKQHEIADAIHISNWLFRNKINNNKCKFNTSELFLISNELEMSLDELFEKAYSNLRR